jgi:hypothetical protein
MQLKARRGKTFSWQERNQGVFRILPPDDEMVVPRNSSAAARLSCQPPSRLKISGRQNVVVAGASSAGDADVG